MTTSAYLRPSGLDQALELRGEAGTVPLAGGTDLTTLRAERKVVPERILDLKAIDELGQVSVGDDAVEIGATARLAGLRPFQGEGIDAVVDGASIVGSAQTRRRATIGGNVCRSSPAGDTLPGLLVLGTTMTIASRQGRREIPAAEFFLGPGRNVLEPEELLVSLRVPRWSGSAYARLTYRRWMDLAVIGVGVALEFDGETCVRAAAALGGVAPTPLLVEGAGTALAGTKLDEEAIAAAIAELVAAASPIDDVRGTREYRLGGIEPLARKVIDTARERAIAPSPKEDR